MTPQTPDRREHFLARRRIPFQISHFVLRLQRRCCLHQVFRDRPHFLPRAPQFFGEVLAGGAHAGVGIAGAAVAVDSLGQAAFKDVMEICFPSQEDSARVRLSFWQDGLPIEAIPPQDYLQITAPTGWNA